MAKRERANSGWRFLAVGAAAIAFAPVALWWARLLHFVPDATPLAGIEFVPPSWLLVPVIVAVPILAAARYRIAAGVLVFAWLAVALFRGDHALGARGAPATAGGADVGLFEWNVAGIPADEVAARLQALRPDVAILAGGDGHLAPALVDRVAPWRVLDGGPGAAILVTPHRVLTWRTVELPADADRHRLVHAEVELSATRVHVLAVNLADPASLSFRERLAQGGLRLATRDAGSRFLTDYVGGLKGPVIVGGDLDVPPSTEAVRRLAGIADDLLLADHPVGLASLGTWQVPVRADYLFVRDLEPVRSERLASPPAGGATFGVARLPVRGQSSAAAVP